MIELVENNTVISVGSERRRFKKWPCGHAKREGDKKCTLCEEIKTRKARAEERASLPFYLRPEG